MRVQILEMYKVVTNSCLIDIPFQGSIFLANLFYLCWADQILWQVCEPCPVDDWAAIESERNQQQFEKLQPEKALKKPFK